MKKTDEQNEVLKAQKALKVFKIALGKIEKINREAGRMEAANAAYKWQQKAGVFHAEAAEDLYKYWPQNLADDVIGTLGGGDR